MRLNARDVLDNLFSLIVAFCFVAALWLLLSLPD